MKEESTSRIVNGDCTKELKKISDNSIDCIITDPPYNLGLFMHKRGTNLKKMRENQFAYAGWDDMEFSEWKKHLNVFFKECSRVLKKKGNMVVFMSVLKVGDVVELAEKHGFYYKTTGIWHKTNPMPRNMNIHFVNSTECWIHFINNGTSGTFNNNGKVCHDYIESSVCPLSEKKHGNHPTQKPLSILKYLLEMLSNPKDVILDPFMGSGSTCVAAAMSDRQYIGIELNDEYFKIAQNRLNDLNK